MDFEQEEFDKLLRFLNVDREQAAAKYETIRCKLITFFEQRRCPSPEELTDETINRVIKKIAKGISVISTTPDAFFFGVARYILLEYKNKKHPIPLEDVPSTRIRSDSIDEIKEQEAIRLKSEQRMECLDRCMDKLQPEDRYLIMEYYKGETKVRIETRRLLTKKLEIPNGLLRTRALRLRKKLEDCIIECLKQKNNCDKKPIFII